MNLLAVIEEVEEPELDVLPMFIWLAFFVVLIIAYIVCFCFSVAIDRTKKTITIRSFRILKRCLSWLLILSSVLLLIFAIVSWVLGYSYANGLFTASYIGVGLAIALLFVNMKQQKQHVNNQELEQK